MHSQQTYPMVKIDLNKFKHNIKHIHEICRKHAIEPIAIIKATNGSVEIAEAVVEAGISAIGDSRLKNLKSYAHVRAKKMLIRIPMMSEIEDVVRYSDVSLHSELTVIRGVAEHARKTGKTHEIILMVEVGDLREGIYEKEELFHTIKEISQLEGVTLTGLGTNLNCFGSIKPTNENLQTLVSLQEEIATTLGIYIDVISGGSSGSLALLERGQLPTEVNQLRIGTAFLNGFVEISEPRIGGTYGDVFTLHAEIVEVKEKPSKPYGETGVDSFRNETNFPDKGIRKRAICAIGKQDTEPRFMYPVDKNIEIIGSSSDHLVLDITDCEKTLTVGDTIQFVLDYVAILRIMTSEHVRKVYV